MLDTQDQCASAPSKKDQPDVQGLDRKNSPEREDLPRDPTRYGDWEVGGRCIDF